MLPSLTHHPLARSAPGVASPHGAAHPCPSGSAGFVTPLPTPLSRVAPGFPSALRASEPWGPSTTCWYGGSDNTVYSQIDNTIIG